MALPLLAMAPLFMQAMQGLKDDIASGQKDRLAEAQGGNPGMGSGMGMLSQGMSLKAPSMGSAGGGGGMLGGMMPPSGNGGAAMDAMAALDQPYRRKRNPEE